MVSVLVRREQVWEAVQYLSSTEKHPAAHKRKYRYRAGEADQFPILITNMCFMKSVINC